MIQVAPGTCAVCSSRSLFVSLPPPLTAEAGRAMAAAQALGATFRRRLAGPAFRTGAGSVAIRTLRSERSAVNAIDRRRWRATVTFRAGQKRHSELPPKRASGAGWGRGSVFSICTLRSICQAEKGSRSATVMSAPSFGASVRPRRTGADRAPGGRMSRTAVNSVASTTFIS